MFDPEALSLLSCPECGEPGLRHQVFDGRGQRAILEALVWCGACGAWFPLEDGVLDLLIGELEYGDDRDRFHARYRHEIDALGAPRTPPPTLTSSSSEQAKQQTHFDWYSDNDTQSYLEYEQQSFWLAADYITFSRWRPKIRPGAWLLDVGCGNGRSTFKLGDLDLNILAFDVAKSAVRQAEQRSRSGGFKAHTSFFVADATKFPVPAAAFDYVLLYGVLHHMPDPGETCRAIAHVLKPGGIYFGHENSNSALRGIFEALQRLRPQWHEEAGPEEVISDERLRSAFAGTGVSLQTQSSIFVPPHLINLLPVRFGRPILSASDRLCSWVPWLNRNGGVLLIEGTKAGSPGARAAGEV